MTLKKINFIDTKFDNEFVYPLLERSLASFSASFVDGPFGSISENGPFGWNSSKPSFRMVFYDDEQSSLVSLWLGFAEVFRDWGRDLL